MIKELIEKEKEVLEYFFKHLDLPSFEKIFEELLQCKGMIICTGIGKSGLVAKKIAATMTSTNTRALFLSAVDALHGDIGIASSGDVCLLFSKSGETEELLCLMPALRNKNVKTIAVVSNSASRLAKLTDIVINLPVKEELCPYNIAPTTSTLVQLIFGDILAIALMSKRNFSLDDFALNHPAGHIGKRTTLKVKDLMIQGSHIPLAYPDQNLMDILVELSNKRCGCVLIPDKEGKLLGIFTDGDLRRALQNKGALAMNQTMNDLMTKNPRKIESENLVIESIKIMEGLERKEVSVLPVVDNQNKIVGLIKLHDIIQAGF